MKKNNLFACMCLTTIFLFISCSTLDRSLTEEYMALNGMAVSSNPSVSYITLDLPSEADINLVPLKKALCLEKGFLYVGAPWCPYCRNTLPLLLAVLQENGSADVYAVELDEEKSLWSLDEKRVARLDREGTPLYQKLLQWLSPFLRDYVLSSGEGDGIPTGEKRIYMPAVFYIEGGVPRGMWSLAAVDGYVPSGDAHQKWSDITSCLVSQSLEDFFNRHSFEKE